MWLPVQVKTGAEGTALSGFGGATGGHEVEEGWGLLSAVRGGGPERSGRSVQAEDMASAKARGGRGAGRLEGRLGLEPERRCKFKRPWAGPAGPSGFSLGRGPTAGPGPTSVVLPGGRGIRPGGRQDPPSPRRPSASASPGPAAPLGKDGQLRVTWTVPHAGQRPEHQPFLAHLTDKETESGGGRDPLRVERPRSSEPLAPGGP